MEVKQVCGYLGADDKFYKEQYDAALSIKVRDIKAEIRTIELRISDIKARLYNNLVYHRSSIPMYQDYSPHYASGQQVIDKITLYPQLVLDSAKETLNLLEEKGKLEQELQRISDVSIHKEGYIESMYHTLKDFFKK